MCKNNNIHYESDLFHGKERLESRGYKKAHKWADKKEQEAELSAGVTVDQHFLLDGKAGCGGSCLT